MRYPPGPIALLAFLGTFLLPFIGFWDKKVQVMNLTGYEIAVGKKVQADTTAGKWLGKPRVPGAFDVRRAGNGDLTVGKRLVTAALMAGLAGGIFGFRRPWLGGLGGIAAVVLLLVAQSDMRMESYLRHREEPLIWVKFELSFWWSLGCAGFGGVMCFLRPKRAGPIAS